ncbi:MAG TPA: glutamine-hydrolyzing GMP synthase, partial [Anaerolineales bacterium]
MDSIAVIDFGSQYAQLITRRVREARVYSELFPWDAPADKVLSLKPKGFILSGGPASVYEPHAPHIPTYILDSHLPVLGICYGMQALTYALGGSVAASARREFGPAEVETTRESPLLPSGKRQVWMSHGDRIEQLPEGFITLAHSPNSPYAAIGDLSKGYFGLQFHPEVRHTQGGSEILRRFALQVCAANPEWTPASIVTETIQRVQQQVGAERIISAVSGGVDSSVATTLVQRAVGDQLVAVFVNNGLLRQGEAAQVVKVFHDTVRAELVTVDAVDDFMSALQDITEPEQKRRIIGELFIRTFEAQARQMGKPR